LFSRYAICAADEISCFSVGFGVCVRPSYVVPTTLSQGIKLVNPMFRGYAQQVQLCVYVFLAKNVEKRSPKNDEFIFSLLLLLISRVMSHIVVCHISFAIRK